MSLTGRRGPMDTVNQREVQDHAPVAFLVRPEPWMERAVCVGSDPKVFFDHIDNPTVEKERLAAIKAAQDICAKCPVRVKCGEAAMREEGSSNENHRYGFRAYMTPQQRVSIHRRGGLRGRDPLKVVNGIDGKRRVPPVPLGGDKWTRHHTTLARKLVRWINDNVEIGEVLPTKTTLQKTLGCKGEALKRVLDALVQDGTLDYFRDNRKVKYRRRSAARMVSSWLPPHLRESTHS